MRTAMIMGGGVVLWFVVTLMAKRLGASVGTALLIFAALWTAIAAANMYIGVTRAGYTVREELPIFLVIVLVPVAVAFVLQRRVF